jgi:hypothetical protein
MLIPVKDELANAGDCSRHLSIPLRGSNHSSPFFSVGEMPFPDATEVPPIRELQSHLCFVLIRGDHESFNRLALNESIHNLRDVGDRDASVEKVIGFD